MNDIDENLIQRCIDNELSAEERRALLSRLDETPGGWKSLACGFIEDQLFADAAINEAQQPASATTLTSPVPTPARHWFSHPVTSLILSVSVAFLAGVLVHSEHAASESMNVADSDRSAAGRSDAATSTVSRSESPSPDSDIKVRLVGDGEQSQELPFFEADDYPSKSGQAWERIAEYIEERKNGGKRRSRMIMLKIGGQTYIIPVEEFETTSPFQ